MKLLRKILDDVAPHFEKGGKLHDYEAFYEAPDTLLFTPSSVSKGKSHVRDAIDLKRMMITVVVALIPCVFMAVYNTGYQANLAIAGGAQPLDDFNTAIYGLLGFAHDPSSLIACLAYGACYFVPVFLVTFIVGGHIEMLFAVVRKHEVNEGFLVTGFLFPLICPPTIPLWQVAAGIAFGVIVGKEIFGGTGMNVLNPALTGRAFLFFAYPAQISGDQVWTAVEADGFSGATWLSRSFNEVGEFTTSVASFPTGGELAWWDAFVGFMPGSMGETSAICCLIGAAVLLLTRVGAWETMLAVTVGTVVTALFLNGFVEGGVFGTSVENPMFHVPWYWHMVLGGWAFGAVFMATDPVSSAYTSKGRLWYGFLIGVLVVLIRVVNPAYPEGMMLAILFMNLFAPLFDHFVVQANIKRRNARYAA